MKGTVILCLIIGLLLVSGSLVSLQVGNTILGLFLFFWGGLLVTVSLLYPLVEKVSFSSTAERKWRPR